MAWQKGVVWFGGIAAFAIGYGMYHGLAHGIAVFGLLLMFTTFFGELSDENTSEDNPLRE